MLATTRSQPLSSTRGGTLRRVGLLVGGCLVALALLTSDALAAQLPVSLGAASSYAALAGSTVTSTGPTTLNGDLGVWPGTSRTGFPPGMVTGTVHAGDRFAMHAQGDLTAAYNDAAGRQPPQALPPDVGGRTLAPGVYKTGATPALGLTGALTLDGQGDPNAVFIFQVDSALTTSVASRVNLIGGAQSCNVFWQIGSSATLGTSSVFAGSILALSSISINDGVTLNGRALARNGAVTLINDTITAPHCTTGTIPGGPAGGGPTGGGTTPGGTTPGPTPGGTTGGDTRPPTPPLLLSPRAHARVRAGIVNFSWRPAARAQRYTLIVDHHRMNTGPRTRATMLVRPGSHRYRVIAQNRYGARSSRHRAFSATAANYHPWHPDWRTARDVGFALEVGSVPLEQLPLPGPVLIFVKHLAVGVIHTFGADLLRCGNIGRDQAHAGADGWRCDVSIHTIKVFGHDTGFPNGKYTITAKAPPPKRKRRP